MKSRRQSQLAAAAETLAGLARMPAAALRLERKIKGVPHDGAVLAVIESNLVSLLPIGSPERAEIRAQFGSDELTSTESAALRRGGVGLAELRVGSTLALAARRKADSRFRALFGRGLTVGRAAATLGVTSGRVRQRLLARELYGIKLGDRDWRLPAFQFQRGGLVPGIDKVIGRLPEDIGPMAVHGFFTTPNPDLTTRDEAEDPLTPLEWLRGGNPSEAVAVLAEDL